PDLRDCLGLAAGLDRIPWQRQATELRAIGVRLVLLRIGVWQLQRLDDFLALVQALPQCRFCICIMQDRACLTHATRWEDSLLRIVGSFRPFTREFQCGQAINRLKWGCAHVGEGLELARRAEAVLRPRWPELRLIAPSILDFEPLAQMRCHLHLQAIRWHAAAAALYVDRRGGPEARQYGAFDVRRKIRLWADTVACSRRCAPRLWITESNWPLRGAGPHAPACPDYQVDEATYDRYMRAYLTTSLASGLVERVYWWQLMATGYGLIDPRDGRRRPAWWSFKGLLEEHPPPPAS
ncbi:MAG: hypothetical protein ACOCXA_03845, partial [Planctomycetota bacterium]